MRIKAFFVAILMLAPGLGVAEPGVRTISVSGHGEVVVVPDMATITLGVTRQGARAGEALGQVAEASRRIFAALEKAGIAARDMQTSNLELRPLYSDGSGSNQPPRIVGYQASSMVTIRVLALDRLGQILDQVAAEGANQFNGLSFGVQDPDPLLEKARVAAVKAAMARAAVLARAAGVTLGPVLSLNDQSGGAAPRAMADMAFVRAAAVPVAAGELSISADVSMVFAIAE